jgi:carboxyl-terminal processing protease
MANRAAVLALILGAAACGARQQVTSGAGTTTTAVSENSGGRLIAQVLDDIGEYYIEPVSAERVALAGAARVERLDRRLAIRAVVGGGAVALNYDGRQLGYYATPAESDTRGWAAMLETVIAGARQASPQLAALPRETVEQAAVDGMSRSLDRFSRYASPDLARDQRAKRDGWGSIGVTVDGAQDTFKVTAVAPQSPAEGAGIHPEDQIVAIDGVTTHGCVHHEIIDRLRGPVGSQVALSVVPAGMAQPRQLTLRRTAVSEPTVTASVDGGIAVIRVHTFNHRTTRRVAESLAEARRQTAGRLAGIVLDLRSNPGGVLDEAVSLADLFLAQGPVVSVVGRHPASRQYFKASGRSLAADVPMAVLINGGSASASEIVAAALQDAGRAVVIGSASYGKGSVQTVLRLPDSGELILTWARLFAPSGYALHRHGVIPTICTADLPDDARSLSTGLQRAAAATAARPRASLDEQGWADLRRACPAGRTRPVLDLLVAKRLFADQKLYAAGLHAAPPAGRATQPAAAAPGSLP